MGNVNAKRIARNTLMLYVRMILIMVINIYMARIVLKVLGIEDYGIYSVVAGAVAFLGFFNSAMSMATQRFLNVELGKRESSSLRKVFNMALNIHVIIGFIIIVLAETIGLWIVNYTLNIPQERMLAANWAFQCVIFSTFFSIIQTPFNSAVFAYEKMDVYAYLSILDVCLRLALTFALEYITADKLILYSLLMLGVHILVFLLYSIYVSRAFRDCRLSIVWDTPLFKSLSGFLGWNICGQIAQVLTNQGVNMIANVFLGVLINAAISITHHVNGSISLFVNNFQTSFRPQIMKSYAAGQFHEMHQLVYKASKASFFLLYIISVPIMLNLNSLLSIWLEDVPKYSEIFCKLLIWYSYFEALGMPLVMSIMATGRNKYYQIFVSLAISLNLLFTWIFLWIGFSPEWIFYIKIAVSFLVIAVRMYFAYKQAGISYRCFFDLSIIPVLKIILITMPVYFLIDNTVENAHIAMRFFINMLFVCFIMCCIYKIGFTKSERFFVKNIVLSKLKRK